MDQIRHTRLAEDQLTRENLEGSTIYDTEHNTIGTVSHLHGAGAGVLVVIDVGGFLGIGIHPVAIPALDMAFMQDEAGEVHAVTNWTKEELKNMPRHDD